MKLAKTDYIKYIRNKVKDIKSILLSFYHFLQVKIRFIFCSKEYNSLSINKDVLDFKKKNIMIVWPFIAVGGAEKNVLNLLQDSNFRKRFNIIVLELSKPLDKCGDLSNQFIDNSDLFIGSSYFKQKSSIEVNYLINYFINQYNVKTLFLPNGSDFLYKVLFSIRILNPRLLIVHQVYDHEFGYINSYNRFIAKQINFHIAVNTKIQTAYINNGVRLENAPIIYHCIDSDRFKDKKLHHNINNQKIIFNLPPSSTIISFIGRLHKQKRPLDFLKVANRFRNDSNIFFLMVGNGPMYTDVINFICSNNIKNVSLIDFQSNPQYVYACSDIVVMTSEYEGLPLVVLESLLMEIPVVSTNVGGIIDFIADKYNGVIVDEIGNIDKLQDAINYTLVNLQAMKKCIKESRHNLVKLIDNKVVSKQYSDLFNICK